MAGVDVLTQVKQSFTTVIEDVQPLILSRFIAWLDLKVAQYKTFGYIVLDETEEEINLKKQQIFFLHKGKRIIPSTPRSGCELDSDTSSVKTLEISVEREAGETAKVLSWQGRRTLKCNSDEISPDNLESNGASKLRHSQENLAEQTGSDNILGLLSSLDDPAVSQSTLQGPSRNILCATRSKADTDGALALSDWASGELSANEKERFQIKIEPVDNAAADEDVDVGFDAEMDDVDSPSFKEDFSFDVSADSVTSNKEEDTLVKVDVQKKQRETDSTSTTEISLIEHEDSDVPKKTKRVHSCRFCKYKTTSSGNLSRHIHAIHNERKFNCQNCSKQYTSAYDMKEHYRVVHLGETIVCHHCGRTFSGRKLLNMHVRFVHAKESPFKCPYSSCVGKRFYNNSQLQGHMSRHTHVKAFKCKVCGRSFAHRGNLSRHSRIHTNRKLVCLECGKEYSSGQSLKDHMRGFHGDGAKEECLCGKLFQWRSSLTRHKKKCVFHN